MSLCRVQVSVDTETYVRPVHFSLVCVLDYPEYCISLLTGAGGGSHSNRAPQTLAELAAQFRMLLQKSDIPLK